ncbi:MAG: ATP-binding cassette domain-containing protein [Blautia marasmi]
MRTKKYRQPEDVVEREVRKVAEMMNITELLDRKPTQASNGQRQRIALGRALVRNPNVFLMDEPLAHLDAKLRNSMRKELKSMQEAFYNNLCDT